MPVAGDEGYETLVICPYDRSHEVRQGRMQFHLDKCRKNFPEKSKLMIPCPYNTTHLIPKFELQFHEEEECLQRASWDRHKYQVGESVCSVEGLVPVNAATLPDDDENWDDFESKGSVLNLIKTQAAERPIVRMMQCESKAKRKNFRREERIRLEQLASESKQYSSGQSSVGYATSTEERSRDLPEDPPLRSRNAPMLVNKKQDPQTAAALLSSRFRTLDLDMKTAPVDYAPSDTSSLFNVPPSEAASPPATPSTSKTPGAMSYASMFSRPSTAMSTALSSSSRPSTAMSIATSSAKMASNTVPPGPLSEDKFCQIPVPGLGRGSRRRMK